MSDFKLAGFQLIEKVGEGGMGQVWKARQLSLDRLVAIKFLPPRLSHDPESIKQIIKEARTAAKLKHPGIVHVYDASEQDGHCCLVMEFIDGYTVGQWVTRKKMLAYKDALVVVESVATALKYAWREAGLIHCDIKPENIMIDHDGTIKVADLGLSLTRDSQVAMPASDEIAGTPGYISPEQVQGEVPLDCRTDIYALGCCLYQMVTGVRPFSTLTDREAMEAQVSSQIPDPREIVPDLPASVCGLIEWMLVKNRENRLADWDAVLKEMHRVQKSAMMTRSAPPEGASTMRRRAQASSQAPEAPKVGQTTGMRIAAILGVGAVLASIQVWWLFFKKDEPVKTVAVPTLVVTNAPVNPGQAAAQPAQSSHDAEVARATKRIKRVVEDYSRTEKFTDGVKWLESYKESCVEETRVLRQQLAESLKSKKAACDAAAKNLKAEQDAVAAEGDWSNRVSMIASCVLSGKYAVACQQVETAQKEEKFRKHQADLTAMARVLTEVGLLTDKVLKTYESDKGRMVSIPLVRGPFVGRLIDIQDRKLVMKTMNDTVQVNLRLEEIAPAERQARLATLDLPEAYLVRGVLAYSTGKDDEGDAFMVKSGSVLAPILIANRKNIIAAGKDAEMAAEEAALRNDPAFLAFAKLLKRVGIDVEQIEVSKMRNAIESASMDNEAAQQADRDMDAYLEAHGTSAFADKHADLVLTFQSVCGRALR